MEDQSGGRRGRFWLDLRPRGRRALEAEVAAELDEHVALRVEHLMGLGLSRQAAEAEAVARLGDLAAARKRLVASATERERMVNRRERLAELRQDAIHALRLFRSSPGFYLATVLILALGIGANGAVFSILRATLLEPLPYRAPAELLLFWRSPRYPPAPQAGATAPPFWRGLLTRANVERWRQTSTGVLADLAVAVTWQGNLDAGFDLRFTDRTERLRGALVTPNFFDMLGVPAAHGRLFTAADAAAGEPLVVLSDGLWRRAFGADPAIVGASVTLTAGRVRREPRSYAVLGVLPPAVRFSYPEDTEAWVLLPWPALDAWNPNAIAFLTLGRLAPGATVAQVRSRAAAFLTGPEETSLPPESHQVLAAEPIRDWVVGDTRPSLYLLAGVAGLLLLMTCVTVANAMLARVTERQRELALRASLGAGRPRLMHQLVTEGAMLSLSGTVAGAGLALLVQPVLGRLLPASLPQVGTVSIDPSIVLFAAAAAGVTTILAMLTPAIVGTAGTTAPGLLQRSPTATADRSAVRWRRGLLATQAAVATTLLVAASLLLTSLWRLGRVPLGFDGTDVLTVEMRLIDRKFRDDAELRRFQDLLLERLRAISGVAHVGLTTAVPFRGVDFRKGFRRPGEEREVAANYRVVDSTYFRVLAVPLLRGRLFTSADVEGAPRVMIVSQSFARAAFGTEDPVGKVLDDDGLVDIVGVVGDLRYQRLDRDPLPAVYLARSQTPSELVCVLVRAAGEGAAERLGPAIRAAVHEVDPAVPAMRLATIDRILAESVADRRFYTAATAAFAGLALLLTTAGLAVVVARVVADRRRELAIRAALGATRSHLVRQASGGGLRAVGIGVGLGLVAALAGSSLLAQFLFQVPHRSPAVFSAAGGLVTGVAALTAWLTSRRVARLDLGEVLRVE